MFASYYGTGSGSIYYATASSPDAAWTVVGTTNQFNFTGAEGQDVYWTGGNNWTMTYDLDGTGYRAAFSTTGIGGPYNNSTTVVCPWIPEQGAFVPLPAGFPNPALQSKV